MDVINNSFQQIGENGSLEKNSFDLILADPPYGVTNTKYDKDGFDVDAFWSFIKDYIKKDGVVVITAVMQFAIELISKAPKGWFRYDIVWEKTQATGHLNAKKRPMRAHELLLVFSPSGSHTYNPQMTHGHVRKVSKAESKMNCRGSEVYNKTTKKTLYDSTDRYPRSVIKFATDKQKLCIHPNQKPVALLEWIVKTYTNEDGRVLDPVAGSGSTGIACLKTGRECTLIEKDETYFKDMVMRLSNYIDKGYE